MPGANDDRIVYIQIGPQGPVDTAVVLPSVDDDYWD
jgi:hypothetical protein